MATFKETINNIIKDVENDTYTTVLSFGIIVNCLDNLSDQEKSINYVKIKRIKNIIKGFTNLSAPSSIKQKNILLKVLNGCVLNNNERNINSYNINSLNNSERDIISYNNLYYNTNKFDENDIITDVVYSFLTKLNDMNLSSSITNFVVEYYNIINLLIQENYTKYDTILKEIDEILEKEGWFKNKGFQREPNSQNIVSGLSQIIGKYF